jgi:SAM-dependent methyltransferase
MTNPTNSAVLGERDAGTVRLFDLAIRRFGFLKHSRILDFGCGAGSLVRGLESAGYESFGCDFVIPFGSSTEGQFRPITTSPRYALPFPDEHFDVVVSTSVLEHAQNKRECFEEMRRVLKPGGFALHLFPAKMFLPVEPHINVPLLSWFWPHCPDWWFALWALIGIRNDSQRKMDWREVAESNREYSRTGLSYWFSSAYEALANETFGNAEWKTRFYLENSAGKYARVVRKLPVRPVWDYVTREFRYSFLLMRKHA